MNAVLVILVLIVINHTNIIIMKTNYEATANASNCIVKFNVYANNYEASFLENVWGDEPTLLHHLIGKFEGLISKYKKQYKGELPFRFGTACFYEFYMMLDSANKEKLNKYIINHKYIY